MKKGERFTKQIVHLFNPKTGLSSLSAEQPD